RDHHHRLVRLRRGRLRRRPRTARHRRPAHRPPPRARRGPPHRDAGRHAGTRRRLDRRQGPGLSDRQGVNVSRKPAPPQFNHVAMSLPADALDAEGRAAIIDFYSKVFGFEELPTMTIDRERLILKAWTYEQ